jgi:hypothetical protein
LEEATRKQLRSEKERGLDPEGVYRLEEYAPFTDYGVCSTGGLLIFERNGPIAPQEEPIHLRV